MQWTCTSTHMIRLRLIASAAVWFLIGGKDRFSFDQTCGLKTYLVRSVIERRLYRLTLAPCR